MFEIKLDNQPQKFLKGCEDVLYRRLIDEMKSLGQNPVPHNAKRMVGYELPTFRVRVGKHRVLYRINYESKLIVVVKIDHRETVY